VRRERREAIAKVLFITGIAFASITSLWVLRTMVVTILGGLD
jgi:hypothetical protein